MAYSKDTIPSNHSEFGGGPGMVDPEVRKDRVGLTNDERLLEIYATNPAPPGAGADEVDEARIERENNPETAPIAGLPVED